MGVIKIDEISYQALQKLKEFVEFVGNLKLVQEGDKNLIPQILRIIEELNDPAQYQEANVTLDIFDYDLQSRRTQRSGVYWRTWGLYFEKDSIEIVAASYVDDIPPVDIDTNYFYQEDSISLTEKYFRPINNLHYFDAFVEDAKNYKKYMTEYLNELKVDIFIDP